MRAYAAPFACLALAACADPPPQSPCSLDASSVDISFPAASPYIIVPTDIDGRGLPLVFDTGAQFSVLTPEAASLIHARIVGYPVVATGIAGPAPAFPILVRNLSFGNGSMPKAIFYLQLNTTKTSLHESRLGFIGNDIIGNWAFDLDRAAGKLSLYDEDYCRVVAPPWKHAFISASFTTSNNQVIVQTAIDGHPLLAALDTGAQRSTMLSLAADTLGADTTHDKAGWLGGIGKRVVRSRLHHFKNVTVAGVKLGSADIFVVDGEPAGWSMILGEDLLRRMHIFVSYRQHRIFIDPVTAPAS